MRKPTDTADIYTELDNYPQRVLKGFMTTETTKPTSGRKPVSLPDVIDTDFKFLKKLAKNLLVENKNFETGFYQKAHPSTYEFIREVLPRMHEGIAERIENIQDVVRENMVAYDEALGVLESLEQKLAALPAEQLQALGLTDDLVAIRKSFNR